MLLPTLPLYVKGLGGSKQEIGLIIGAFAASALIGRLPVGWLLDKKGSTKGLIVAGTVIFLVSSILYNFATSVPAILAIRLLHGAGMAACNTSASTLVAHITPPNRRGEAMGVFGMAANMSMALGPFLGIWLLQATNFHTLFIASAVLALIGVLLALPLKDHPGANRVPQASSGRMLVIKRALFPSSIIFCTTLTYGVIVSFVAIFTDERKLGNAGSFFLVYAVALAISRTPAGRISDKYGRGVVIVPGMAMLAGAMLTLAGTHSLETLMASAAVYGIGSACVHSPLMALAVDGVDLHDRGLAMGAFTAAWELGISSGSVVFGYVWAVAGFEAMFATAAGAAAVGGVVFLIGTRNRQHL